MSDDDKEFPKLLNLMHTPTVFDEDDADPDVAHELGWITGHDFAIENLLRVFGGTEVAVKIAEYVNSEQYTATLHGLDSAFNSDKTTDLED